MKFLALFLLQVSLVLCRERYDNYTLYQIVPQTEDQLKLLRNLQFDDDLDFWNEPTAIGKFVDILVAPEKLCKLSAFLDGSRSGVEVLTDNLQKLIENEKIAKYSESGMTFDAYYVLEDIYQWLDDLVEANPRIVTKLIAGETYEGRKIEGVKISHGAGRRAVFLEGGIHSREWISMATVCYITDKLVNSEDTEVSDAARNYDWYIFPVTNPDGYVRSHEVDRMWRKNTRPVSNHLGSGIGVDLNRNWNAFWMEAGTSVQPTHDAYGGPGPFSEIETRTMSEYLRSIIDDIELYISFHSFGQMLLLPYGHTTDHLDNYDDAVRIGRSAMGALSVNNDTQYVTGNIAEVIYLATGGSIDWVKLHHVPLVYCYELRDLGQFGFLLPWEQIIPTGEETMDSIMAMFREGKRLGYFPAPDPRRNSRAGGGGGGRRIRVGGGRR